MTGTDQELFNFLARLKKREVISVLELSGDDIFLAEKLVEMKLASKQSTAINSFYFYGIPESKQQKEKR